MVTDAPYSCKLSPHPHVPKTLAHNFACRRGFQINGTEIVSGQVALESERNNKAHLRPDGERNQWEN